MNTLPIHVGPVPIGPGAPLAIIAGPCVAESYDLCVRIGQQVRDACAKLGLGYIFKASFDKANRSSIKSDRGPGLDEGLELIRKVGQALGVPVTTDVHESHQCEAVAQAADLLQIPAFLCRQTDLLVAAAKTGKPVNVKKGQFMSPAEMGSVVEKLREAGGTQNMLTERGTFFGYNRLVNDFLGLGDMMDMGVPVCFDVTHSTQLPGGGVNSTTSGQARVTAGRPDRAPLLAKCAVAAGVDALFIETHPEPAKARSDAATMLPVNVTLDLLPRLAALRRVLK
ncbi:MAG: 3-deoxy-8-phosphooctulonate synthase [Phycisphaera sp.]|nr:3-deoxy-8-phosphooctulonate synthase [Phycisphaera sp.]